MLQKKVLSNTTESYYLSIDELPIYNWNKIFETSDLDYLKKNNNKKVKEEFLVELWVKLQNEYLDEFGLESIFKQKLEIQKKIAIKNYEFILKNDRFILTEIDILNAELKSLELNKAGLNFWQVKDKVEQSKGYRFDAKIVTVIEWFYALKELSNGKANKGDRNNRK